MTGSEILTTAIEGGIGYWAAIADYRRDGEGYWLSAKLVDANGDDEAAEFGPVTVTAGDCSKAARRVLTLYPDSRAAAAIKAGDIDGEAADLIVQVAAFGEGVYG